MYKDCASIAKCNGTTEQWKVKMSFCSCTALCLLRCWVRANNQSIVDWRLIRAAGPDVTHRNSPIFSLSPKLEWNKLLKFTNFYKSSANKSHPVIQNWNIWAEKIQLNIPNWKAWMNNCSLLLKLFSSNQFLNAFAYANRNSKFDRWVSANWLSKIVSQKIPSYSPQKSINSKRTNTNWDFGTFLPLPIQFKINEHNFRSQKIRFCDMGSPPPTKLGG